jgi:putative YpdA family bacillithiol system oxidoreductase
VEIPYVTPSFETNIPGVFIVGELGGMGLIKNAVVQGREAVEYIAARERRSDKKVNVPTERRGDNAIADILIVGAGPAGIAASLAARHHTLRVITIDQSDIGGSVLHYPRHKIVMTSPVELPIYGKVKLKETTKEALLDLWTDVIRKTGLKFNTQEKMTELVPENGHFKVVTTKGEYRARHVILAIGRRGTPRKLDVPGENLSKVTYRLLEPEQHINQPLLVVGGGDSAIEAALALSEQPGNRVTLSYRQAVFSRIKPANQQRLDAARSGKRLEVLLQSQVSEIREKEVVMRINDQSRTIPNDFVYIFAGGELPNEFLRKIGIRIEKKFGKA